MTSLLIKLLLKRWPSERWEHEDSGDYDLERFDQKFRERLYSAEGRKIMEKHVDDERRSH